jgi:hypothetical protein
MLVRQGQNASRWKSFVECRASGESQPGRDRRDLSSRHPRPPARLLVAPTLHRNADGGRSCPSSPGLGSVGRPEEPMDRSSFIPKDSGVGERDDHDIPSTAPRPNGRVPRHDAPGLDTRYRPGSFHFRLTQATPGPRLFSSCPRFGGAPSVPRCGPSLAWFAIG